MTSTASASSRRAQIVELALQGFDGPSIAGKVKLSLRQTRRYLAQAETKAQIRLLEDERLRSIARRAAMLGDAAVVVLATIMRDSSEPAAARVGAAGRLIDVMVRLAEAVELVDRVEALEQQLGGSSVGPHHPTGPGQPAPAGNGGIVTWARRTG